MFTKHSMSQGYETPLVCMHQISAESGFAISGDGANSQGLFDFSGDMFMTRQTIGDSKNFLLYENNLKDFCGNCRCLHSCFLQ